MFFCPLVYGLHTWCFTTFRSETRLERQHPRRNCQFTRWYAGESHEKLKISVYSVYRQWGIILFHNKHNWCYSSHWAAFQLSICKSLTSIYRIFAGTEASMFPNTTVTSHRPMTSPVYVSTLTRRNAGATHTGTYTCTSTCTSPVNTSVHVLRGGFFNNVIFMWVLWRTVRSQIIL